MADAQVGERLRGAVSAAAAIAGVRIELVDGAEWAVESGAVHVGIDVFDAGTPNDDIVARVLVLVWESVRESRVAPFRRARRLALAQQRPELEPALALIDRLLSAAELITALPHLRGATVRMLRSDANAHGAIGELPRHLQWLQALIICAAAAWDVGGRGLREELSGFAPEVVAEIARLEALGAEGVSALPLALAAGRDRTPMRRFERAYGVTVPAFLRLLDIDAAERGLSMREARLGADDSLESAPESAATAGAGSADDATPGGDSGDAANEGESERARAGDTQEAAEGADLFAAEQAGFVQTVLATPLPADGAWDVDVELPDLEAAPDSSDAPREARGSGSARARAVLPTELTEYRARVREHESSIAAVREVWRTVIAERVGERRAFTRVPEPWGDALDRGSLARVIAEATAGVERPRAFVSIERRPKRTRRTGSTDYVLLVDRSASMQGAPAEAAATAAMVMLESLAAVERDIAAEERQLGIDLELALRTSLIVFDTVSVVVKPLAGALDDAARRRVHAEIRTPRGSTNDAAALRLAAHELGIGVSRDRGSGTGVERRRVVIFVSDGGTDDGGASAREISALRRAGVAVFGIGIRTNDLTRRFAPDGVRLDDPAALASALERLITGAGLAH